MSKDNLRDQIADSFVQSLSEDRLPWRSMWANDRAYNATTGKDYRGLNALWLSYVAGEKGYTDPRWCTYRQAQDNGWQVRRGEKATSIEFYSVYDTRDRKAIGFAEADAIVRADPARGEDMKIIAKHASVFNAQQIDGVPELKPQEAGVDIEAIRAQRDVLLKNMQLEFHEGGSQAYYSPSQDSITMPRGETFENDYAYMSTLLHECGHATAHESRLNRLVERGGFGSPGYAKEELRAEIASAFTAQTIGIGKSEELSAHMGNHKAYVQSWIQVIKDKPNELFAAIKDAEKISDYLIEKGEFQVQARREQVEQTQDLQVQEQDDWRERMAARRQERQEQSKERSEASLSR